MALKILIVEDLAIEANDLRRILQNAGHAVTGIAKSVDQALGSLKKIPPDVVLIDIYLKGPLTGIHLARMLAGKNIPFVYLSANSNPSTLEAAKATQPYGFLVKPFREKDILVALDIASYRHNHAMELKRKQEQWLGGLLSGVLSEMTTLERKLLLLVKAFKPFLSFEMIFLDTNGRSEEADFFHAFQRAGFDEFHRVDLPAMLKKARLTQHDLNQFREDIISGRDIVARNEKDFLEASSKDRFAGKMLTAFGIRSALYVPLPAEGGVDASVVFWSTQPAAFTQEQVALLHPMHVLLSNVIRNIYDQRLLPAGAGAGVSAASILPLIDGIIGKSPQFLTVLDAVVRVAASDTTVLITGETGVGKEGLAEVIHRLSNRKTGPLVKVNCAAIPETLIESELFGHEKGAFTDAVERRIGRFEQAQGGTIFLDEIGELPLPVQSKLLRVLQEKEIDRLGGKTTIKVDVRFIAATNRQLLREVAEGRFRMDLYYRINVFPIIVPPLRERLEDLPLLADHFLRGHPDPAGRIKTFSPEALAQLAAYSWPGNIRQLQHLVERHVFTCAGPVISSVEIPEHVAIASSEEAGEEQPSPTSAPDREKIIAALEKCQGKVSGAGGAAELLGIKSSTLASQMRRMGISWKYILK